MRYEWPEKLAFAAVALLLFAGIGLATFEAHVYYFRFMLWWLKRP